MNSAKRFGASACMAWAFLSSVAAASQIDVSKWTHSAPISITGSQGQLAEFAIPAELHDATRGRFFDLRVADEEGQQVPYALVRRPAKVDVRELTIRLYNRTSLADTRSATVDFGKKVLKNRIAVLVEGVDFRREVLVEGCDDGVSWQVVKRGAVLFRASAGTEMPGFERNTIELPAIDLQYLRIAVKHAAGDPGPYEIKTVKAWSRVVEPAETVPVAIVKTDVTQRRDGCMTDIEFDLAFRNLELESVALDFAERNFFRQVTISGRSATHRTVRKEMEDGSFKDSSVEVTWQPIVTGTIHRFAADGDIDEGLTFDLPAQTGHRYIRLRIDNRDDLPLRFKRAEFIRLVQRVAFQPELGKAYSLYLGNAEARAPSYDFARFAHKLRADGVREAELGEITATLAEADVDTPPWSEQHKWLLWLALLAVGCVLGLLVWRQAKEAGVVEKDASAGQDKAERGDKKPD